jgi:hypothetical protein
VYLTDVEGETGPHVYIRGSHRKRGSWRARSYSPAEIEREYGAGALCSVSGPAGTSFLADTYGIHKGETPVRAWRLMLQVQYALLPNYALDYGRVRVPDFVGDPYLWQLLADARPGPAAAQGGSRTVPESSEAPERAPVAPHLPTA